MNKAELLKKIKFPKAKSAWGRGVQATAYNLVVDVDEKVLDEAVKNFTLKPALLNGAESWDQYSWGGCALCYDVDIAKRFCTPSELKRTRHGNKRPNSKEEWLDVQARGLYQAFLLIESIIYD